MVKFSQESQGEEVGDARKLAAALGFVTAPTFAHVPVILYSSRLSLLSDPGFRFQRRPKVSSFLLLFHCPHLMHPPNWLLAFLHSLSTLKSKTDIRPCYCVLARRKMWYWASVGQSDRDREGRLEGMKSNRIEHTSMEGPVKKELGSRHESVCELETGRSGMEENTTEQ